MAREHGDLDRPTGQRYIVSNCIALQARRLVSTSSAPENLRQTWLAVRSGDGLAANEIDRLCCQHEVQEGTNRQTVHVAQSRLKMGVKWIAPLWMRWKRHATGDRGCLTELLHCIYQPAQHDQIPPTKTPRSNAIDRSVNP